MNTQRIDLTSIKNIFPDPTGDQKAMLESCGMALTENQRNTIANISLDRFLHTEGSITALANKIAKYQVTGAVSGTCLGALVGGASAATLLQPPPIIVIASIGGGVVGGVSGYYAGKKLGEKIGIEELAQSASFRLWKNQLYREVFPIFKRVTPQEEWEEIHDKVHCPITLQFIEEPVQAADGRYYEKSALTEHLRIWSERWTPAALNRLTPERRAEIMITSSPVRVAPISLSTCSNRKEHYCDIFNILKTSYNQRVLEWDDAREKNDTLPRPYTEKVSNIVNFYLKTPQQREAIAKEMMGRLYASNLSCYEVAEVTQVLLAAITPPRPI